MTATLETTEVAETTSEGPLRGLPLLRAVFKTIDEHPELWDQSIWARLRSLWPETDAEADAVSQDPQSAACGTACCVAGWAAVLGGEKIRFAAHGVESGLTVSGRDVSCVAEEFLGITEDEADQLFAGNNTRDDLQRVGEQIAAARGETL